jgi:hypothetical protein
MFTLLRQMRADASLAVEAPAFLAALAIAETFYKLHSFSLECILFLATWWALGSLGSRLHQSSRRDPKR